MGKENSNKKLSDFDKLVKAMLSSPDEKGDGKEKTENAEKTKKKSTKKNNKKSE